MSKLQLLMQLQLLTQKTSSQKTVRYMIQTCLACRLFHSELLRVRSAKPQAWLVPVWLGPCAAALFPISPHLVQLCDLLSQCIWHQHTIQDQNSVAYQQIDVTNSKCLLWCRRSLRLPPSALMLPGLLVAAPGSRPRCQPLLASIAVCGRHPLPLSEHPLACMPCSLLEAQASLAPYMTCSRVLTTHLGDHVYFMALNDCINGQ